ncbi:MAG: metallophosphoesterase [Candidatus Thermoplasmatota archaeon]|nr:metallophosphoesterase [Candidatus Thermoplasmatota archaeon]
MGNNIFRKGLVFTIIGLIIGTGFLPNIGGNTINKNKKFQIFDKNRKSSLNIDLWSTFKSYTVEADEKDNAIHELIKCETINFTIIALPDVQNYNEFYPNIGLNQTKWIVNKSEQYNIVYVCNEGDLVNNPSVITQYINADASFSVILNSLLPFTLIPGNHDTYDGLVNYNNFFPPQRFDGKPYYGGHYGATYVNNYVLFNASGLSFIAIGLEYNPSFNVLNWADGILKSYSNRRAIVVEHCILDVDGSWQEKGKTIYNTLKDNSNLFLILCGHIHGESRRIETYNGNTVNILLADYQSYSNGGNGYLRIMEFCPSTNEIRVKTYSPYLNQYETDANSQFNLSYNMMPTNNPPNKPIINGIKTGTPGISYDYKFTSSDPDTDDVSYYIDWDDGITTDWTAFQASGTSYSENHIWNSKGILIIKAKARDINGAERDWATLKVSMPKTYSCNPILQLFMKMLERFPFFKKILNPIL